MIRPAIFSILAVLCTSLLLAQTPGGPKTRSGKHSVKLWPPTSQPTTQESTSTQDPEIGKPHRINGWIYRAEHSGQVRDGVPWELIVTPDEEHVDEWQLGTEGGSLPSLSSIQPRRGDVLLTQKKIRTPAIEVPEVVWKK